ncbi:MAG: phosphate/phosphite/phosphonate ABC transporter substrate-binding protein [Magnetospirillum sp.]|nr:phosphate/phosphite/phosphonate ABC transporter substrate-binding protein [Magnetospirillum sp.]
MGVLAFVLTAATANAAENRTYNFSPVNQFGVQLTASYWNPIIDYVSTASGVRLILKVGRTSADTTSFVLAQEVDFAFTNHLFSDERRKMGWTVFGRRDYPPVHGEIVVLAESPIRDITELNGQDVAFAGPEALIAYKSPYAHLLSRNIQPKVVFGGNQDGAIAQLRSGKVKAIGANSQLIDGYAKRENVQVRKLWSSEPFNDLALMVSPRVPSADAKAVAKAFLEMGNNPQGAAILKQVSELVQFPPFSRFVASSDDEYTAYFNFYKTAPVSLH